MTTPVSKGSNVPDLQHPRLSLDFAIERWAMSEPVRITGYSFSEVELAVVTLSDGTYVGRGEAAGVYYHGDTPATIKAEIEAVRGLVERGITRAALRTAMPPGGARNAVDCALWDLESKQFRTPVWTLAGGVAPGPLVTTYTLGGDTPEAMAAGARGKFANAKALKLKLLGDGLDADRIRAVRAARDDVWLGIDANQGFTPDGLNALLPVLVKTRVQMIEQPFKIGEEALLDAVSTPIPFAADESMQSLASLPALVGRFQVVNIKLDKCGGLTEGLLIAQEARKLGFRVMVGAMPGTSLAMAPAFVLGQQCDIVDLDAPLFLSNDRTPSMLYDHGSISAPAAGLWGWSAN